MSAQSSTRVRPTVGTPELRTLAVGHLIMAAVAGLTRLVLWFRYFLTNTVEVEPRDTEEMLAVLAIAVHVALAAVFFRFDSAPGQRRQETVLYFTCVGLFFAEAVALALNFLPLGVLAALVALIIALTPFLDPVERCGWSLFG